MTNFQELWLALITYSSYYLHFADEETEAEKEREVRPYAQSHTAAQKRCLGALYLLGLLGGVSELPVVKLTVSGTW